MVPVLWCHNPQLKAGVGIWLRVLRSYVLALAPHEARKVSRVFSVLRGKWALPHEVTVGGGSPNTQSAFNMLTLKNDDKLLL